MISEKEYSDFVERLWIYPPEIGIPPQAYCAMAIAGEAGEFVDATFKGQGIDKEAGDLTYYVVKLLNLEDRSLSDLAAVVIHGTPPRTLGTMMLKLQLMIQASALCEKVKKHLRDTPQEPLVLVNLIAPIWDTFTEILRALNLSFSDILDLNVAKLSSRLERGTIQGSGDDR